jgi:hypothetical protein
MAAHWEAECQDRKGPEDLGISPCVHVCYVCVHLCALVVSTMSLGLLTLAWNSVLLPLLCSMVGTPGSYLLSHTFTLCPGPRGGLRVWRGKWIPEKLPVSDLLYRITTSSKSCLALYRILYRITTSCQVALDPSPPKYNPLTCLLQPCLQGHLPNPHKREKLLPFSEPVPPWDKKGN